MSMLKNVGIGIAGVAVVSLVGYLGFKGFKKLRGKDNMSKVDEDLLKSECKIFKKEDFEKSIKDDEEFIKDLENLHYSEDVIAHFKQGLKVKKGIFENLKF